MKKSIIKVLAVLAIVALWTFVTGYSMADAATLLSQATVFGIGMAALTADRITEKKMTFNEKAYPVKDGAKIFAGSLVAIQADGHAVPASDAAATKVVGLAIATVDNTAGADGDLLVRVESGLFLLPATSITQAMVGSVMYVVDDQTFDDVLGTNGVKAGRLLEFVSTTEGWLYVEPTGLGIVTADGSDAATTQALANAIKANLNKWQL